jgi:hypothetical protein
MVRPCCGNTRPCQSCLALTSHRCRFCPTVMAAPMPSSESWGRLMGSKTFKPMWRQRQSLWKPMRASHRNSCWKNCKRYVGAAMIHTLRGLSDLIHFYASVAVVECLWQIRRPCKVTWKGDW